MNVTRDADVSKRVPTYFENVLIRGCYIYDVDRTGISNKSAWQKRTLHENIDWTPSRNIVIRENTFEKTGANALIVRVADAPLVEHNVFTHCTIKGSGNASFPFNCDNALFQYNEACFTKYNEGDADAGGFDSDYRCKNTVIQYNYNHDNEYGGVLVCCIGRNDIFIDGTIIRYNIFENNKHHVSRVSGTTTNTRIYNNVVFTGQELNGTDIIWHKSWRGYVDQTAYYNNIFYTRAEECEFNLEKSTNNEFAYNVFFGGYPESEPEDPFRIVKDPLFVNPGRGGEMGMNTLNGYQLQDRSPCINTGIRIDNHGEHDFWNRPLDDGQPDIGAFEK